MLLKDILTNHIQLGFNISHNDVQYIIFIDYQKFKKFMRNIIIIYLATKSLTKALNHNKIMFYVQLQFQR